MKSEQSKITRVPINIITGFLGVGKTTLVLNILKQKPAYEKWAVLVNEFGEIGVDGALVEGSHPQSEGIFVREVPGGCICCAAGLPMQIVLNQLLARAKPDRLLIEPTGLGHPKEVLEVLSAEHYRKVLTIQQCITLVDARKIADTRYTEHPTFNQQIDMADIIIGHKADLCDNAAKQGLIDYVQARRHPSVPIHFVERGNVDVTLLEGESNVVTTLKQRHNHSHESHVDSAVNEPDIPECGYLSAAHNGDDYSSIGWRFAPNKIFNRTALYSWLGGLQAERAKGLFITDEGIFGYNLTADTMTEMELDDCVESRLEIIFHGENCVNEDEIFGCLQN